MSFSEMRNSHHIANRKSVRLGIHVDTSRRLDREFIIQTGWSIELRIMHACTFRHATRRDFRARMLP